MTEIEATECNLEAKKQLCKVQKDIADHKDKIKEDKIKDDKGGGDSADETQPISSLFWSINVTHDW